MTTVLSACNDVLELTGFPKQTVIFNNGGQTAIRILAACKEENDALARENWPIMLRRHTFDTVSSIETYNLPGDFLYFVDQTTWNSSEADPLEGPLDTVIWQANQSGLVTVTVNQRFTVYAEGTRDRVYLDPIPTTAESLTYFYRSKGWLSDGGVRVASVTADDNEFLFDPFIVKLGMKWRFLRMNRRAFEDERNEYILELKKALARAGGMPRFRIRGAREPITPIVANIPETGFGS